VDAQRRPTQIALGFFSHHAGAAAVAWSGGSEPGDQLNPAAIEAMTERGIDIAGEYPKPWTDEIVRATDVVITMGCGDACPVFPASGMRSGRSTIQPVSVSPPYVRSATKSNAASSLCSTSSAPPPGSSCPARSDPGQPCGCRPVSLRGR